MLQVPGSNVCQQAGARGGIDGPNRSLMEQDYNNFAPRVGVAWDVKGNGKTALRAGLGHFFLRERLTPVLSMATNPPFVSTIAGARTFDSTRMLRLRLEPRRADARTGSGAEDAQQLAMERDRPARGLPEEHARGRLRRQLRLRPAADAGGQPGAQRRHQCQRRRRSARVRADAPAALQRCGSSAYSATTTSASGRTPGSRLTTRCRRSGSPASAEDRSSRRRTPWRGRGQISA